MDQKLWHKLQFCFCFHFFHFVRKKWKFTTHKWPFYDHFWPIFRQLQKNLSKNWSSNGHFEVLTWFKFWLVQKSWHKTQIFPFPFFCDFVKKSLICVVILQYLGFLHCCVFFICVITFETIKFCGRYSCNWQKMARNGQKTDI